MRAAPDLGRRGGSVPYPARVPTLSRRTAGRSQSICCSLSRRLAWTVGADRSWSTIGAPPLLLWSTILPHDGRSCSSRSPAHVRRPSEETRAIPRAAGGGIRSAPTTTSAPPAIFARTAASVTGSKGGLSSKTMSYEAVSRSRRLAIAAEPRSSPLGFGGIWPDGRRSRVVVPRG